MTSPTTQHEAEAARQSKHVAEGPIPEETLAIIQCCPNCFRASPSPLRMIFYSVSQHRLLLSAIFGVLQVLC